MAKVKSTAEKRADFQRSIDQLDLDTLNEVVAIFESDESKAMLARLEALYDNTDKASLQRPATSDPNALLANALQPWWNAPVIAAQMAKALNRKMNPDQVEEGEDPVPPIRTPQTPPSE